MDNYQRLNIFKELSAADRDRIYASEREYVRDLYTKMLGKALRIPYLLCDDDVNSISQSLNRIVKIDEVFTNQFHVSPHPYASCMNWIAYHYCNNEAVAVKRRGQRVMEIGGKYNRQTAADHCCHLINDANDATRASAAFLSNNPMGQDYLNASYYGTGGICQTGAHLCPFQADYAYCINAAYDIEISQWYQIFQSHQLVAVDLWMYLPLSLLCKGLKMYDDKHFSLKRFEINGEEYVDFNLRDMAKVYRHKVANWAAYMKVTKIEGPDFDINFEITTNVNSFVNIRLVRTRPMSGSILRTIPFSHIMRNYVRIPNLFLLMQNRSVIPRDQLEEIIVAEKIHGEIVAWGERQVDGALNYSTFAAFASSKRTALIFGGTKLYEPLDLDPVQFTHYVFTAYLMSAIQRYKRTQMISLAFNKIKDQHGHGQYFNIHFIDHIMGKIANFFDKSILDPTNHEQLRNANAEKIMRMFDMEPLRFHDHDGNEIIKIVKPVGWVPSKPLIVSAPRAPPPIPPRTAPLEPIVEDDKPRDDDTDTVKRAKCPTPPRFSAVPSAPPKATEDEFDTLSEHTTVVDGDESDNSLPQPLDAQLLSNKLNSVLRQRRLLRLNSSDETSSSSSSDNHSVNDEAQEPQNGQALNVPPNAIGVPLPQQPEIRSGATEFLDAIPQRVREELVALEELSTTDTSTTSGEYLTTSDTDDAIEPQPAAETFVEPPRQPVQTELNIQGEEGSVPIFSPQTDVPKPLVKVQYLIEHETSLFSSTLPLMHTVSVDLRMGAGIALQFKQNFGGISTYSEQIFTVGDCGVLYSKGRPIMAIATKNRYFQKPVWDGFALAVKQAYATWKSLAVTEVACPRMGCGLDKLKWSRVRVLLEQLSRQHKIITHVHFQQDKPFNATPAVINEAKADPAVGVWQTTMIATAEEAQNSKPIRRGGPEGTIRGTDCWFKAVSDSYCNAAKIPNKERAMFYVGFLRQLNERCLIKYYNTLVLHFRGELPNEDEEDVSYWLYITNLACTVLNSTITVMQNCAVVRYDLAVSRPAYDLTIRFHNAHYWGMGRDLSLRPIKYNKIIDAFNGQSFIDISAAPGHLSRLAKQRGIPHRDYYYAAGDCKPFHDTPMIAYDRVDTLIVQRYDGANNFLCDIGAPDTESAQHGLTAFVANNFRNGDNLVIKVFTADHLKFLKNFERYEILPAIRELSCEYHLCCYNYNDCFDNTPPRPYQMFVSTWLQCPKEDMVKLNVALKQHNITVEEKAEAFGVTTMFGVAGAAKTTNVIKNFPKALIVVPTNELKEKLVKEKRLPASQVVTMHIGLRHAGNFRHIYIDEANTMPVSLIAAYRQRMAHPSNLIIGGDVHQIGFIDYEGVQPDVRTVKDCVLYNNNIHSFTVPADVIGVINAKYGTHYTTSNGNKSSLYRSDYLVNLPTIVFNQASKEPGYATIHEVEGSRYRELQLYIDNLAAATSLEQHEEHVYVALTRHTDKLVIVGHNDQLGSFIRAAECPVYHYVESSGILMHNETHFAETPKVESCRDVVPIEKVGMTVQNVVDIYLRSIRPLFLYEHDFGSIVETRFPSVAASAKVRLNKDELTAKDFLPKMKYLTPLNFVRQQGSNSRLEGLFTFISRYAQKANTNNNAHELKNMWLDAVAKLWYGSKGDIDRMRKELGDPSFRRRLQLHMRDYLIALTRKLSRGDSETLQQVEELLANGNLFEQMRMIKFFSKAQGKFIAKDGFNFKVNEKGDAKCGQGVATWPKFTNILLSAYFRCILEHAQDNMMTHTKNMVVSGQSEDDLNDYIRLSIKTAIKENNKRFDEFVFFANDFSEFDTTFADFVILGESEILRMAGCPIDICNQVLELRSNWKMVLDGHRIWNHYMQLSGYAGTFTMNTNTNGGLVGMFYDLGKCHLALWKGDDSLLMLDKVPAMTPLGKNMTDARKYNMKVEVDIVAEFAGNVITEYGLFPDVIRRVAKFISKPYRDEKHLEEAKMSVNQDMAKIRNGPMYEMGVAALAYHYKALGISTQDIRNLFSFADRCREFRFEDLLEMQKLVWVREYGNVPFPTL